MNFLDKIKSYYKEHKRDILKICKIVVLSICLLFMLFSCAVDVFAYDIPEHAPPTETNAVTLPENYNVIPVGTYTIRYNELDFETYPLSEGVYSFRCVCAFGLIFSDDTGVASVLSSLETTLVERAPGVLSFSGSPNSIGYTYNTQLYGWNFPVYVVSDISTTSLSFDPISFVPFLTVSTDQNVGYEFGAFFHNNFMLVDNSSTGECPTIEELLIDYPDEDMAELLYDTKPEWFNQNNQDFLTAGFNEGKSVGYTEGSQDTANQLQGTFLGDLVGGALDALDKFVIYTDSNITISMLTAIRSVFAALFVMWILKLIAGG